MNDSEVARLEEHLQLDLPEEFIATVRRVAKQVQDLDGMFRIGIHCPLLYKDQLIRAVHSAIVPGKAMRMPNGFLVCGYEDGGEVTYLINTHEVSPQVWRFSKATQSIDRCETYPTLTALGDHAIRIFQSFNAEEKREYSSSKKIRPSRPSRTLANPLPIVRPAADPQFAKSEMMDQMVNITRAAGFELVTPKRRHFMELLIGDVISALPPELHSLYTVADGGNCASASLEIIPLATAADWARIYFQAWPTVCPFPFVRARHDPVECFVSICGPIEGYVIAIYTGHFEAILARNVIRFFEILERNHNAGNWNIAARLFGEFEPGQFAFEFASNDRTPDDLRRAREMLLLAEKRYQEHELGDEEYRTLFAIAFALFSEEQASEIIALLKHPCDAVRTDAKFELNKTRTPEVGQAFEEIMPGLTEYIADAVNVLRKEALDAHQVNGVWVRLDPRPAWIGPMNSQFEDRHRPDHWEWFIKRARHIGRTN